MSRPNPYRLLRASVLSNEALSPSFVRLTLAGEELQYAGTPGRTFDQRVKLIFPNDERRLPAITGDDDWYNAWLRIPAADRGEMRTYSLRDVLVDDFGTRFVIDIVRHGSGPADGPGAHWARHAKPGDEVIVVAPARGTDGGGIEFDPAATDVLLAGDASALPAIARILEDVSRTVTGVAFIEVPNIADAQVIAAPPGVTIHWLAQEEHPHGKVLVNAVTSHLGLSGSGSSDTGASELLWETRTYSGLGEALPAELKPLDRFYWVAAESSTVATIRKALVSELGISRSRYACMGYWRAPRS